jgi:hypothetical protein
MSQNYVNKTGELSQEVAKICWLSVIDTICDKFKDVLLSEASYISAD